VAALLTGMGVQADPEDVVTSSQAAARLLSERLPAGSAVLVVGSTALRHAVQARGLRPVSLAAEEPKAVVQGFDPNISYGLMAEGAQAVAAGALYVISNGDMTIPAKSGPPRPGNGALAAVIKAATGTEPLVAGKPERPLHRESMLRTHARRPLVVGDRLDTDIEGAHNGEADSLLVFTGVTDPLHLLTAVPEHRPTYIAADLNGLLTPHPEVRSGDAGFTCEGWTATWRDDKIDLTGDGDFYDGLRAMCGAAWHAGGPATAEAVTEALGRLRAVSAA
jgi:HAD superfamily hydrolase (TIGR01450 family)